MLNSCHEVRLYVICLSAVIMSFWCCMKYSVISFVWKCHMNVMHWNEWSCILPVWKVSTWFQHKFQDLTVPSRKTIWVRQGYCLVKEKQNQNTWSIHGEKEDEIGARLNSSLQSSLNTWHRWPGFHARMFEIFCCICI
jgi:hypothetical protein